MTINDKMWDEKLRYGINAKAAKLLALSSGNVDKYEYLTGKEILLSKQQEIIEQTKFTYSPLGKAFEKHIEKQLRIKGKIKLRLRFKTSRRNKSN